MNGRRAVFLDRDGVVTRSLIREGKPYAPHTLEEMELLPGVPEAIRAFKRAGYLVIIVTNQPDVGAGRVPRATVEAIHTAIRRELEVDDIRVCYHIDADACGCRKPQPGMLLDAASDFRIDLSSSVMIGDRWRDIDAGHAAGCQTILVRANYEERPAVGYDAAVDSLLAASRLVIGPVEAVGGSSCPVSNNCE